MLDQSTKQKIDSARNILVGKVPDPKAQVEQITTALIYKFMDDMDKEAEELGGKPTFFTGNYAKYSWSKLFDPKLSGPERLSLYIEAMSNIPKNPDIPELFRNIFKGAFLPYNDPRTLSLFLKEINEFSYDHSENLGNAFEYLLSVLGSQGDAGQFRTPRHIIDFIIDVVNPKITETILDPACGTAGFLISSYKHILKQNKDKLLSPSAKNKLAQNLVGYDISPDMVKLALVNMYLHGFKEPKIYEYDTLSSETRWEDTFDIILANPPFMTPKGGIRPHSKFSVQANRSEVLFVSYIIDHLNINGRAGIIVPEGIIFQASNAYKDLRKKLIEDGLIAVISLPGGVFNPYSGVKTSILIIDKELAKKTKEILFIKISSDGFDLGAQRREIDKNNLPNALSILQKFKKTLNDQNFTTEEKEISLLVERSKIAESGDYNLTGERYRESEIQVNQKWPMVELGEVIGTITPPKKIPKSSFSKSGRFAIIDQSQEEFAGWSNDKEALINNNKPLVIFGDHTCIVKYIDKPFIQGADGIKILKTNDNLIPKYLYYLLKFKPLKSDGYKRHFTKLKKYKILLPPISVQKDIVEQIEVKQKAIDSAKELIDSLERERVYFGQSFRKLEGVEWVELGEVCEELFAGGDVPKNYSKLKTNQYQIPIYSNGLKDKGLYGFTEVARVHKKAITISARGTIGFPEIRVKPFYPAIRLIVAIPKNNIIDISYMKYILSTLNIYRNGNSIPQLTVPMIKNEKIPLPPLEIQKKLVAETEKEEEIIAANKNLIEIMEKKIEDVINDV